VQETATKKVNVTPGMARAMSGKFVCPSCGVRVPRYPGRYPSKCPACGASLVPDGRAKTESAASNLIEAIDSFLRDGTIPPETSSRRDARVHRFCPDCGSLLYEKKCDVCNYEGDGYSPEEWVKRVVLEQSIEDVKSSCNSISDPLLRTVNAIGEATLFRAEGDHVTCEFLVEDYPYTVRFSKVSGTEHRMMLRDESADREVVVHGSLPLLFRRLCEEFKGGR